MFIIADQKQEWCRVLTIWEWKQHKAADADPNNAITAKPKLLTIMPKLRTVNPTAALPGNSALTLHSPPAQRDRGAWTKGIITHSHT